MNKQRTQRKLFNRGGGGSGGTNTINKRNSSGSKDSLRRSSNKQSSFKVFSGKQRTNDMVNSQQRNTPPVKELDTTKFAAKNDVARSVVRVPKGYNNYKSKKNSNIPVSTSNIADNKMKNTTLFHLLDRRTKDKTLTQEDKTMPSQLKQSSPLKPGGNSPFNKHAASPLLNPHHGRSIRSRGQSGASNQPFLSSSPYHKSFSSSPSIDIRLAIYKYFLWPCSDVIDWLKDWKEDTLRLWLMALVLLVYMGMGCGIFSYLEYDYEQTIKNSINMALNNFTDKYPNVNKTELRKLLDIYGNATYNGFVGVRPRWDIFGSLYFTWTVVSTVGYGMTTPHTLIGKMFLMVYGLLGCAGGILFFNLFLERVINLLANTLRWLHTIRKNRKKSIYTTLFPQSGTGFGTGEVLIPRDDVGGGVRTAVGEHFSRMPIQTNNPSQNMKTPNVGNSLRENRVQRKDVDTNRADVIRKIGGGKRDEALNNEDATLERWKPSVYWVLIILFLLTCFIGCTVSLLYSTMEDWSYTDSLYFCFISFATIGFGDFVSNQKVTYDHVIWYKIVNFVILALGSCCVYSLLNVISIVIKQFLNLILNRLKRQCWRHCRYCLSKSNKERFRIEQKSADKTAAKKQKRKIKKEVPKGEKKSQHHHKHFVDILHHDRFSIVSPKSTYTPPEVNEEPRGSRLSSIHAISAGFIKWKRKKDKIKLKQEICQEGTTKLTIPNRIVESHSRRPLLPDDDQMDTYNSVYVGPLPPNQRKFSDISEYYSRSPWRKDSGDLVSMQDFGANKPDTLEDLQRQLLEANQKIGFSNTLFLPYGAANTSFEEESPINLVITSKYPTESALNDAILKSPDITPVITTSNKPFKETGLSLKNQIPQSHYQQSQRKLPFNIIKSEPPAEFKIIREIVYSHRKPLVSPFQPFLKSTNIIISTDTDYDEEEQILRDDQKAREILLKNHEGSKIESEMKVSNTIPRTSFYHPKDTIAAQTSSIKYKPLLKVKDESYRDTSTSKDKTKSNVSRITSSDEKDSSEDDENESEISGTGQEETSSSEEDENHRLGGEEVGPLAIINKTLREKH